MLLPLVVSFALLLFSSSVSLHLSMFFSVSSFHVAFFLLLWSLSSLHSFAAVHLSMFFSVSSFHVAFFLLLWSLSSLPYSVVLPVAPVTKFPLSLTCFPPFLFFLCRLSLLSVFWGFPLPLLSSVLACRLRLSLRLFLCLFLLLPPLSFLVLPLLVSLVPPVFLWVPLQLHLLSSLLFPRFLSLLLRHQPLLCLRFLVLRLTFRLFTAFLWHWGEAVAGASDPNIVEFSRRLGCLFDTKQNLEPNFSALKAQDFSKGTYSDSSRGIAYQYPPNSTRPHAPNCPFKCGPLTREEIITSLWRKRNGAAAGPNGILYLVYKKIPFLQHHFCQILQEMWPNFELSQSRYGITGLIHKSGSNEEISHVRLVTITDTDGKILLPVLASRSLSYMKANGYYDLAIRKGFISDVVGCAEHTTMLSELLKHARETSRPITVCWTDVENAFGSLKHDFIQFALDWHHLPEELRPFVYSTMRAYILTPQAPGKGGISLPHSRAIFSKLQNEDKDLFFF